MKICVVCKRRGRGMTIVGRTKRGYYKWACKVGCAARHGYVDDFVEEPMPEELQRRHDILDLGAEGDYISINRPKDAPPLTSEQEAAFRSLASAAIERLDATLCDPPGVPNSHSRREASE